MGFGTSLGAVAGGALGFVASGFNPLGAAAGAAAGSRLGKGFDDKNAANTAASQAREQGLLAQSQANEAAQTFQPFQQAGNQALSERQALLGFGDPAAVEAAQSRLTNNPAFNFQQQAGENSIERAAAARGRLSSGRTLLQLRDFNQQLAASALNDRINSLNPAISQGFSADQSSVNARLGGITANTNQQNQGTALQQQGANALSSGITGAVGEVITGASAGGLFDKALNSRLDTLSNRGITGPTDNLFGKRF